MRSARKLFVFACLGFAMAASLAQTPNRTPQLMGGIRGGDNDVVAEVVPKVMEEHLLTDPAQSTKPLSHAVGTYHIRVRLTLDKTGHVESVKPLYSDNDKALKLIEEALLLRTYRPITWPNGEQERASTLLEFVRE